MAAVGLFNVGRDVSLSLVRPGGQLLKPVNMTDFKFRQITVDLKSRPVSGPPLHAYLPDGWEGSMVYDRSDSVLDNYLATLESNFYSSLGLEQLTITETVREVNGSISQYRFDNVAVRLEDGGSWKADSTVAITLGWMASTRTRVA